MANLHSRRVNGDLVWWDTHRNRWLDAIGPNVARVIDHFDRPSLLSADAPIGWTVTLVEAGAGESTITFLDEVGGTMRLTTDAAENDGINMQIAAETFKLVAGKPCYFGIRLDVNDATQSDFLVGLCITDTDLLGGMTDGVYFRKVDATANVAAVTEKNSTETVTAAVLAANTAAHTYEFYFDGAGSVFFYVDDLLVATHTANIVDDEEITPSIHWLTGEAVAKQMDVDWLRAIQIND